MRPRPWKRCYAAIKDRGGDDVQLARRMRARLSVEGETSWSRVREAAATLAKKAKKDSATLLAYLFPEDDARANGLATKVKNPQGLVHGYGPLSSGTSPRVNGGTAGGSLAWAGDGFFYARYPHEGERPAADLSVYQLVYGSVRRWDPGQIGVLLALQSQRGLHPLRQRHVRHRRRGDREGPGFGRGVQCELRRAVRRRCGGRLYLVLMPETRANDGSAAKGTAPA